MEDIAGALGVTKPALYQYYKGKEDLYAAVAEHARQELKGILDRSYQDRDILRAAAQNSSMLYPNMHHNTTECIPR